jgi:hypothetical protein
MKVPRGFRRCNVHGILHEETNRCPGCSRKRELGPRRDPNRVIIEPRDDYGRMPVRVSGADTITSTNPKKRYRNRDWGATGDTTASRVRAVEPLEGMDPQERRILEANIAIARRKRELEGKPCD